MRSSRTGQVRVKYEYLWDFLRTQGLTSRLTVLPTRYFVILTRWHIQSATLIPIAYLKETGMKGASLRALANPYNTRNGGWKCQRRIPNVGRVLRLLQRGERNNFRGSGLEFVAYRVLSQRLLMIKRPSWLLCSHNSDRLSKNYLGLLADLKSSFLFAVQLARCLTVKF